MSEPQLEEHNAGEQSIEYWRKRWELVNTSEENPKPVPQYVLESGSGLIAALETKLKAIMQALKIADEHNIDSEVGFYIDMAFMAAQDALGQFEKS